MLQLTWIFIGLVAMVATVIAIQTADDQVAILGGLIGTISWALWGYSALNVVIYSHGTEFVNQYPALAAFGVMMAIPNLFIALTGPLRIARNPTAAAEEAQ